MATEPLLAIPMWGYAMHPTSLAKWRQRLGSKGMERVLPWTLNLAVQLKVVSLKEFEKVITDTTVAPKAIAYPTDVKLLGV